MTTFAATLNEFLEDPADFFTAIGSLSASIALLVLAVFATGCHDVLLTIVENFLTVKI